MTLTKDKALKLQSEIANVMAAYGRDSSTNILQTWQPALRDASDEVRISWTKAAARAIDALHNSGWLTGAIEQACADTIGTELMLNVQPDGEALGWDDEYLTRWCRTVEKRWMRWADNPVECDMRGRITVGKMTECVLRYYYAFGEAVALVHRVKRAGSESSMKIRLMSPHMISHETDELKKLKQGVFIDDYGMTLGYRFNNNQNYFSQPYDVKLYDNMGRKQVLHIFDGEATQVRGISPLTPILKVVRQYDQLSDATLTMALIQTVLAATITSPQFPDEIFNALNDDEGELGEVAGYMNAKLAWGSRSHVNIGQHGKVVSLFPGEELKMNHVNAPNDNYLDFSKNLLREIARCIGVTYESMTLDNSEATYSSVRMGVSTIWPMTTKRRKRLARPFVQEVFSQWLDEEIASERIEFPGGYDEYLRKKTMVETAGWHGPPRPTADDLKTAKARTERLENFTSSRTQECAEDGADFETIVNQRAREQQLLKAKGLDWPAQTATGQMGKGGDTNDSISQRLDEIIDRLDDGR